MSDPYGHQPYPPQYGPSGHYRGAAPPPPPPSGPYAAPAPYGYGPAAPVHPPPASWPARAVAYLIDGFASTVIFLVLFYGTMSLGLWLVGPDSGGAGEVAMIVTMLMMPLAALASFCYTWIPHARSGQTPGKRAAGVKVVLMKTGRPPSLGLSAVRQLVAVALVLVTCVGTLVDLLWPLWDEPYRQAVHDKAVGTRVIRVRGEGTEPYPVRPQAAQPYVGGMPGPPPGAGGRY
ncbi:RDD family protein [Streptomonospora wellingtoniae]|uniref:RDD family protein n=1 Tax=Streptomonospora wellingtoniae TaxID=3075544 RepID=A0ABU2KRX0_9ACTN|nr:RDD family protein [Streptomonospora sp. DSM 45055]MDT0302031.1 RDD family protein [Streptomonospora sp. DSM 45055]